MSYLHAAERPDELHPMVVLLNAVGCEAMVIGNHEFNFGMRWIETLRRTADFPILGANVIGPDGRPFVPSAVGYQLSAIGLRASGGVRSAEHEELGLRSREPLGARLGDQGHLLEPQVAADRKVHAELERHDVFQIMQAEHDLLLRYAIRTSMSTRARIRIRRR